MKCKLDDEEFKMMIEDPDENLNEVDEDQNTNASTILP